MKGSECLIELLHACIRFSIVVKILNFYNGILSERLIVGVNFTIIEEFVINKKFISKYA